MHDTWLDSGLGKYICKKHHRNNWQMFNIVSGINTINNILIFDLLILIIV